MRLIILEEKNKTRNVGLYPLQIKQGMDFTQCNWLAVASHNRTYQGGEKKRWGVKAMVWLPLLGTAHVSG